MIRVGSLKFCLVLFFCVLASKSYAFDYGISGYGTIGAAITDSDTAYQRYLDKHGTFMRDSLIGVQFDGKFNDQWAVSSQILVAAATDEDNAVAPQLKWTFLSYRPDNDWLIRLGRLSLGGHLNQQNLDVGVSYDMARLPNEVYLLSSAYDYNGLSITKTWSLKDYEVSLDGSFGMQSRDYRVFHNGSDGEEYYSGDSKGGGAVLTITDYGQTIYRFGWNRNRVKADNPEGFLSQYTFVPLGSGLYTLGMPVYKSYITLDSFFLGLKIPLAGFIIACEGTAVISNDADPAPSTYGYYVNVSRKIAAWTPYLTYAQAWSDGIDTWRKVGSATPVPALAITEEKIDDAASSMAIFQQSSWMVGTSYAFSPKHKLKGEVMLTHVGDRSAMFDGDLAHRNVMVYSLSYNFSF